MQVNGVNFTIGADPEVFMKLDGKFVSAHPYIFGTKNKPFKVEHGAVQVDGMALEFNIDPSNSFEEFNSNLNIVQEQLLNMLPAGSEFMTDATVEFDKMFLETVPYYNRILGCEPDYNAYTMRKNKKPSDSTLMRTAGGHIHIGGINTNNPTNQGHMSMASRLSKLLDERIGVYSLLWDKDDKRRSLYGKAGSFRPKTYGMEYRSLSNAWIFNEKIVSFIYNGVQEALELLFDLDYIPNPDVQRIINESDRSHPIFDSFKAKNLKEVLG
ncbi:hypothetical protein KC678_03495 [Candidatus Dojkabacteria bacterium]|uniref:Uncharacterized protein n=1 Tax=Candidatus Dojkabacteria bacterium TaxID=2099670 RepID=A0A955L1T2_9BACT|nr:hypothetical protein [Candidatus Dojkabacteria bacterium]